jgi:UDP-N-acetyl-D-mannosaminuronic acid dehydrogenase
MGETSYKKLKTISVIGIGRVGLPLALVLADEGFTVYGIGRDEKKIEGISNGKMPFLEKGAPTLLKKYINKSLFATIDYSCIKKSDIIILTLGTPIDENMNPVLEQIEIALLGCLPYFKNNQLLILRSTVSPRTTNYVKQFIQQNSRFEIGKNFYLAFCPERISEGNSLEEIKTIPQIIGSADKKSSKIAEEFFKKIGVETMVTDDVTAELGKLFTNMYRYINFAIANEFMVLAQNYHRDIYEIVNLVNHNYSRGGISVPGLTAGPCLFKDGFFLISDLPYVDLISTSWKINEAMPLFLVRLIRERMKLQGKKTVLLGLAFKAEIDDIRESLSFKVRKALLRERVDLILHDPFIKEYNYGPIEPDVYKALENADLIFIATNHKEYRKLDIKKVKQIAKKNCMVCDVWNVFGTNKILFKLNKMNDEL